jgi:hypothetical protein
MATASQRPIRTRIFLVLIGRWDLQGLPASDQNTDWDPGAIWESSRNSNVGKIPISHPGVPKFFVRIRRASSELESRRIRTKDSGKFPVPIRHYRAYHRRIGTRFSKNLVRIRRESSPPLYPADPDKGFRKISCSDPTLQGVCPYVANRARELRGPKIEARSSRARLFTHGHT